MKVIAIVLHLVEKMENNFYNVTMIQCAIIIKPLICEN